MEEWLVLKDGYIGTLEERYSFSVEFIKTMNVKSDTEIAQLLSSIVFT